MKKVVVIVVLMMLCINVSLGAHCSHGHCSRSCSHHNHYTHSSSSDHSVYLVSKDYKKQEEKFANCNKHYMVVETFTNYYSDGTRRIYTNCTIYNADGTVLEADCSSVKHIIQNNNHYFIIRKNRGFSLINSEGNVITKRIYSFMDEIAPNRLLVKYEKLYGIIDLKENIVADIKYQKFRVCGNKIYMTKLNGYYGLMNQDGKILVKNDCERIKPLYDTLVLKKYGKYGLANCDGEIILPIEQDKIKKLGEYIIVKRDKKYNALNLHGQKLNDFGYKKIKLKRNTLFGVTQDGDNVEIKADL